MGFFASPASPPSKSETVLVTDVERRKAIPIIRSLGRAGSRVVGVSSVRLPLGRWSRYCHSVYRVPSCAQNRSGFMRAVGEICRTEGVDVLLPLEEPTMEACLQAPQVWKSHASALLPDASAFDVANDKWKTIQAAERCDIDVPTTYCPDTPDEVDDLALQLDGEWVVKPRRSSGSRGLRYVNDPRRLPSCYREVSDDYPRPLIQRRISMEGAGLGVFACFDRDHNPVAVFGHRRLREYPRSGGPSTLRESWKEDSLIRKSLDLLESLSWTGVAMIEYKQDPATQRTYLMEINPRFWGSIELAIASGVNFPVFYRQLALGRAVTPVRDFPTGIQCRWLLPGDILHFFQNPNRWNMEPSFFQFCAPDLHYDLLSSDDPGPVLGILLESIRKLRTGR